MQGYGMYKADKGIAHKAHRVSYQIHVGPIPEGQLVRHTCDVRNCVQPSHLVTGTDADNNRDMMKRGRNRQSRGELQGNAKLTDEAVRSIRKEYAHGGISQQVLASRYGVTQTCISRIIRRAGWDHVD